MTAGAETASPAPVPSPSGMVWVPGGAFIMGTDHFYPEEAPAHRQSVAGFWMDAHAVSNARFAEFVDATGHITDAEHALTPDEAPGLPEDLRIAGSLVFRQTPGPVRLDNVANWWALVAGANWRHPDGPDSSLTGRMDHPVVHVSQRDARAYAAWAGRDLPSEAEWEFAAWGGADGSTAWPWGRELAPNGVAMANTWQGEFPWQNLALDGHAGRAPVDAYQPNGYGLWNMIGNVWEWTLDRFQPHHTPPSPCCGGTRQTGQAPTLPQMVVKGGSYLCAPNYCRRYRPTARTGQEANATTGHMGFRCVLRPADPESS